MVKKLLNWVYHCMQKLIFPILLLILVLISIYDYRLSENCRNYTISILIGFMAFTIYICNCYFNFRTEKFNSLEYHYIDRLSIKIKNTITFDIILAFFISLFSFIMIFMFALPFNFTNYILGIIIFYLSIKIFYHINLIQNYENDSKQNYEIFELIIKENPEYNQFQNLSYFLNLYLHIYSKKKNNEILTVIVIPTIISLCFAITKNDYSNTLIVIMVILLYGYVIIDLFNISIKLLFPYSNKKYYQELINHIHKYMNNTILTK